MLKLQGGRVPHRDFSVGWSDEKVPVSINKSHQFRPNMVPNCGRQRCKFLLSIAVIICNFTPILPNFQHWGDLDQDFFLVNKLSEDQIKRSTPEMEHFFPEYRWRPKKKVFTRNGTLFFPEFNYRPALRCTSESNYWRGCKRRPYSNCWRVYSQIIGEIYPPRVSAPLAVKTFFLSSPDLREKYRFIFGEDLFFGLIEMKVAESY